MEPIANGNSFEDRPEGRWDTLPPLLFPDPMRRARPRGFEM